MVVIFVSWVDFVGGFWVVGGFTGFMLTYVCGLLDACLCKVWG